MKKILIIALSAMSLAACMHEALVETPQGDAIAFKNPFVDNVTRAVALTESNLEAFQVWGYVNKTTGVLFTAENVIKDQETGLWNYRNTQYWVPGNTYHFAAVAPVSETQNWTLTMETEEYSERMLTFTNSQNADTDLIYAATTVESTSENNEVAFQFSHMLSNVKFSFDTSTFPSNNDVTIYDIKVTTPKSGIIDILSDDRWDVYEETMTITPVLDENLSTSNYFILPAQCDVSFNIKIEINGVEIYRTDQPKTATIPASAFEMGHAYNLLAEITPETLSFDQLKFVVEGIDVWENEGNDSDRAANLIYTAQLGGTYDLTEDLEVNTTVNVSKDLVINLNGKTLKYKGDDRLFKVTDGAVLTINGESEGSAVAVHSDNLTVSTTAAYIGTAYDGSKIIINGGDHTTNGCTLYHANGGTVEINDGTFAATETGYDPAGKYGYKYTLNVQGANGRIIVRGGSFKNYNPAYSEGENPVANFVAEGYAAYKQGDDYIVVPAIKVSTSDAIVSAFAEGGFVQLTGDIVLATVLEVESGKTVHLDLNGKSIIVEEASQADPVFQPNTGAKLIIDGNGIVEMQNPWTSLVTPYGEVVFYGGSFIRTVPQGTPAKQVGAMFIGINSKQANVKIYDGYFDGGYYDENAADIEQLLAGSKELKESETDIARRGESTDANKVRVALKNNVSKLINHANYNNFMIYGGTFVGANPAWGDEGGMLPITPQYLRPWSNYQGFFLEGQEFHEDGIVLPEGYAITKGTHEDGRPTYTVTYNK